MTYCNVSPVPNVACVPINIDRACMCRDIASSDNNIVASVDVIFWADMNKAQDKRWQSWHRVTQMCDPEVPSKVLVCNVIAHN